MSRWNGGIIGAANNPTTSVASGVWRLSEVTKAAQAGLWPASAANPDPYFESVVALIQANGTNGANNNTFLDSSTNNFTITRNGNTTQGAFSPYSKPFGKWGVYIDASTGAYYLPDNALFDPNTALTLECWINVPVSGTAGVIWSSIDSSGDPWQGMYFRFDSTLKPYVELYDYTGGGNPNYVYHQTAMVAGTWNHVAVIKSGSTWAVFLNGVKSTTTFSGSYSTDSAGVTIGNAYYSSYGSAKMYISNLRLVRNASVYSFSGFTPPTSPLTAVTDTAFLGFQDPFLKDRSSNNFAITPYNSGSSSGNPRVVSFSPFAQLSPYTTGTNGGSAYFDGSGDYLSIGTQTAFGVGANDFTAEAWFYPTLTGTFQGIISTSPSTTTLRICITDANAMQFTVAGVTTNIGSPNFHAWNHAAFVRSTVGGTTTTSMYLNGTRVSTNTTTTGNDGSTLPCVVGRFYTDVDNYYFRGYISGARILKGTAVYDPTQSTLTVPTAPFTNVTNTSVLFNMTNAGLRDDSGFNDWESVGSTQVSTTQSKFGGSSILISSTYGSNGLIASNDPSRHHPFRISSSTVQTFECWLYPTNLSSYGNIFSYYWYQNGSTESGWLVGLNNSGGGYYVNAASGGVTNFTGLTVNSWQHFAVVFNAGNLKIFINGSQVLNTSIGSPSYNGSERPGIGCAWANGAAAGSFPGYMDDVRISYGLARYTGAFTAPTAEFKNFGD